MNEQIKREIRQRTMTPAETIALSKAVNGAAKAAREKLETGDHNVDFRVHVRGRVRVGEDHDKAPTASIPTKKALAALAYVAGCTGKAGIEKIRRAMQIALADDDDAGRILSQMMPKIDEIEKTVVAPMLAELERVPVKGTVTTRLEVNAVDCGCGDVVVTAA